MSAPLRCKEIKITPAMIDAGADIIIEFCTELATGHITSSEVAKAVYLAMRKAHDDGDQ